MKHILIDLDSLLDTRLGVLESIDPALTRQVIQSNTYWDREHTDWSVLTQGKLSNEDFLACWRDRDNRVLQASMMTAMIPVLGKILADYHRNMKDGVVEVDVGVEVNIWPYGLEYDDLEVIREALHQYLYDDLEVTFCSRPLTELTPQVMHEHYSAVVLFDFQPWIKHHCFNIAKQRCPGLNLIVPKLFESDPSKLSVESKEEEIIGFRLWLLEYIDIEFIDAQWFSMFRPEPTKHA